MHLVRLVFASHGSRIGIETNLPGLDRMLHGRLPPQAQPVEGTAADEVFTLLARDEGRDSIYLLHQGSELVAGIQNLAAALDVLESRWHRAIALHAAPMLFVHAGVVGWQGRAIVIPGRSMTGKSSLAAALVRAGADYYSDEYAVFDRSGFVHPYPKPLSLREPCRRCSAGELGGRNGAGPLPVGLVVATRYRETARWEPQVLTAGQAVLQLLDNTICARTRAQSAIEIFARVAAAALAIGGDRPSSDQVVSSLLELCAAGDYGQRLAIARGMGSSAKKDKRIGRRGTCPTSHRLRSAAS